MPVISNVLMAKTRLFAIAKELTPTGQAQGVVPTFRYEYLRDKAKEIIAHIKDVDSRMLPIQFRLDDFTEIVSTVLTTKEHILHNNTIRYKPSEK
jgi:hypothetical protein